MLRLGFVDHHLNNFHANKFVQILRGPLAREEIVVSSAWESHPTGEDWCEKNNVPRAGSAEEVARLSDVLLVLAPDNLNAHVELAARVLPAGKPTMVDKLLAPTAAAARAILGQARREGAPLFSASSLRFAVELEKLPTAPGGPADEAFATGMGEWPSYGVHTLSLVLAGMGCDIRRLINTGKGPTAAVTLEYADGRRATLDVRAAGNQWEALPWRVGYRHADRYHIAQITDYDGFYQNLMEQAAAFFKSGKSPLTGDEMLAAAAVIETAAVSAAAGGEWKNLPL